jgi:hypothetical protein
MRTRIQLLTLIWIRFRLPTIESRSATVIEATSHNSPGFDPSILRHSGIRGAADEAVLKISLLLFFIEATSVQDLVSGGACKRDPAGLPDANCVFYPTQGQAFTCWEFRTSQRAALKRYCDENFKG